MDKRLFSDAISTAIERYNSHSAAPNPILLEHLTVSDLSTCCLEFKWCNSRGRYNSSIGWFDSSKIPIESNIMNDANSQRPCIFCRYVA